MNNRHCKFSKITLALPSQAFDRVFSKDSNQQNAEYMKHGNFALDERVQVGNRSDIRFAEWFSNQDHSTTSLPT